MTSIKTKLISILLFLITIVFIIYPKLIINSVYYSTNIFFNNVFTYLFPFLILSKLLISFNVLKLFNIKSNIIVTIILSMINGSPSNSFFIKEMYDNNIIKEKDIENLLITTTNPSITFVTSFIGSILLKNRTYSFIILLCIYLSNFIYFLILNKNINANKHKKSIKLNFKEIILSSIETLLVILGNIVIFNIIISIIELFIKNKLLITLISLLLELTTGITKLNMLDINIALKISLFTFFCLFSSFSIHLQIKSILNNFNYIRYLKYRIIISLTGFIICYLTIVFWIRMFN